MNSILTEAQIIAYHKKMLECEDEFAKNFVELVSRTSTVE